MSPKDFQVLSRLVIHACAVAVFIVFMVMLSWRLTLFVAVGVAVIFGVLELSTKFAYRVGEAAVTANERLAARIVESLTGLKTIQLFGREPYERARFDAASDEVRRSFMRMEVANSVPSSLLEVLFAAFMGFLLLTIHHDGLVSLLVFLALLLRLQPHAAALAQNRVSISALRGAVDNVLMLSSRPARSNCQAAPP